MHTSTQPQKLGFTIKFQTHIASSESTLDEPLDKNVLYMLKKDMIIGKEWNSQNTMGRVKKSR